MWLPWATLVQGSQGRLRVKLAEPGKVNFLCRLPPVQRSPVLFRLLQAQLYVQS